MTTPQWPTPGCAGVPAAGSRADDARTDPHGWPAVDPDAGWSAAHRVTAAGQPQPNHVPVPYGYLPAVTPPAYQGLPASPAAAHPPHAELPHAEQPRAEPAHKWGFGAFLLAEAVFLLASLLIVVPFVLLDPSLSEPDTPLPAPALVISLSVPAVLAAAVALLMTRLRGNGPIRDLKLTFGWRDVGIGIACGIGGVIITIPLGYLWSVWVGEENANSAVGEIFEGMRMPPVLAVLVFLHVWLLAPLCEEILYRGLLWGAMERRHWHRGLIVILTSVVFAAAHFELLRAPLLLVIGLPMGVARLLSGRLPASIIAHQINNFLPALGLMLLLLGVPLTDA